MTRINRIGRRTGSLGAINSVAYFLKLNKKMLSALFPSQG